MSRHLHYGDSIVLSSEHFSGYSLSGCAGPDTGPCTVQFASARSARERWYLLNPDDLQDRAMIRFGAPVALSCFGQTTCCLSLGPVPQGPPIRPVRMLPALGATERWKFVDPANSASVEFVLGGGLVGLRCESMPPFHLSCGWAGQMPAPMLGAAAVPQCDQWEFLRAWPVLPDTLGLGPTVSQNRNEGTRLQSASTEGAGLPIKGPDLITCGVGEKKGLNFTPAPSALRNPSYSWSITGDPIDRYDDALGSIVPLPPLEGALIWFRWMRPGTYTVEFVVTGDFHVQGEIYAWGSSTKVVTYQVWAPTVVRASTQAGSIRTRSHAPIPVTYGNVSAYVKAEQVEFNGFDVTDSETTGFMMTASVLHAPGQRGGSLRWVQLVASVRMRQGFDGATIQRSTGGEYWLDNIVPYSSHGDTPMDLRSKTVFEGDAPAMPVFAEDNPDVNVRCPEEVFVSDSFKMYLMWRSSAPEANWSTIGCFEWMWTAKALRPSPTDPLILIQHECRHTNDDRAGGFNPAPDVIAYDLPRWTEVLTAGRFRHPLDPVGPDGNPALTDWPCNGRIPYSPQAGQRLVIFRRDSNLKPVVPGIKPGDSVRDVMELIIGRRIGPNFVRDGTTWWTTWAPVDWLSVPDVTEALEMPADWKAENLDLSPPPAGPRGRAGECWLLIRVAPFCLGNADYWAQFAHRPTAQSAAAPEEGEDQSLDGYRGRLRQLAPNSRVLRRAEDNGSVWMVFSGYSPPRTLIDEITGLKQTYSIRRVPDGEPRLPPVPDPTQPSSPGEAQS